MTGDDDDDDDDDDDNSELMQQEGRGRQTLCDNHDNNFVWNNFRQTSLSLKQISL